MRAAFERGVLDGWRRVVSRIASHRGPIIAMLVAMLAEARRDHAKTYGMLIAARCRRDISNAAQ